jgi:hypothetical protein
MQAARPPSEARRQLLGLRLARGSSRGSGTAGRVKMVCP